MIKNRKTYNLFKKVVLSKQKECKKKHFQKHLKCCRDNECLQSLCCTYKKYIICMVYDIGMDRWIRIHITVIKL